MTELNVNDAVPDWEFVTSEGQMIRCSELTDRALVLIFLRHLA